jgi:hypothetical protein
MARDRLAPADVYEGDTVTMLIHAHSFDHPSSVTGEVIEAPDEGSFNREALEEGERPLCNIAIECAETGEVYTWNVDNGYVIGFHEELGRHTDIGKFRRFEEADA